MQLERFELTSHVLKLSLAFFDKLADWYAIGQNSCSGRCRGAAVAEMQRARAVSLAGRRFVDKSALRLAVGFACSLSREPRALPCLRVLKISPRPQSLDNTLEIGAVPSLHPAAVVCRRLSALLGAGFNVPDPKVAPVPPVQPVLAVTTSALALLPLQDVPTDGSTSPNTPASDASDSTLHGD